MCASYILSGRNNAYITIIYRCTSDNLGISNDGHDGNVNNKGQWMCLFTFRLDTTMPMNKKTFYIMAFIHSDGIHCLRYEISIRLPHYLSNHIRIKDKKQYDFRQETAQSP